MEGWVVLFLIQEIPKLMYEVVAYLSEDVKEIINCELEFSHILQYAVKQRAISLIVAAVMAIGFPCFFGQAKF